VRGEVLLEVRRTSDGHVLERASQFVELAPGERRISLEAHVSQFVAEETFVVASFLGSQTFRLLSEPKDARLSVPTLSVAHHPEGLLLTSDRPVIDLYLWDPDDRLELLDNFITLPSAGERVVRARGSFRRLAARSLEGVHPVG